MQARQREAAECCETALAIRPNDPKALKNSVTIAVYRDDLTTDALTAIHRRFGRALAQPGVSLVRPADLPRGDKRLRIGYLTSDLITGHPVVGDFRPLLRHHDRAAFAVHIYAHITPRDPLVAQLRAEADGWRDIAHLSDIQVAEQIRADDIDILVSLAGRFDDNRPGICAYRAAGVQISLLDVATSGLDEMDYIIADRWLLPRHTAEYFSERRLRLPQYYQADLPADLPDVTEAADRSAPPLFGCFNSPTKINPTVLRCWGAILAALPKSRLRLKYMDHYQSKAARALILGRLTQAGATPRQVEFLSGRESQAAFLARYNDIDVALDTFPFCGSTTSFHALAMGVPVVTWPWDRFVSRWTESMLRAVALPELIAASGDDYVAVAVAAAKSRRAWRARRPEIRERLMSSLLCDAPRRTRHLERLYRAVWRRRLHQAEAH
jgi:predicted O-linked N-acetylglucosamine transferase (SPINDLY family)